MEEKPVNQVLLGDASRSIAEEEHDDDKPVAASIVTAIGASVFQTAAAR